MNNKEVQELTKIKDMIEKKIINGSIENINKRIKEIFDEEKEEEKKELYRQEQKINEIFYNSIQEQKNLYIRQEKKINELYNSIIFLVFIIFLYILRIFVFNSYN